MLSPHPAMASTGTTWGGPVPLLFVTKRTDRLLQEIEQDALNNKKSIGNVLNKIIALGGRVESTELRDWARRELHGYGPVDELPNTAGSSPRYSWTAGTIRAMIKGQELSVATSRDSLRTRSATIWRCGGASQRD